MNYFIDRMTPEELFGKDYCNKIRKILNVSDSLLWDMFIKADINIGAVRFYMRDLVLIGQSEWRIHELALIYLAAVMCDICKSQQDKKQYVDYMKRDFLAERKVLFAKAQKLHDEMERFKA